MSSIEIIKRHIRYYGMITRYDYTPEVIFEDTYYSAVLDIDLISELVIMSRDTKTLEKLKEAKKLTSKFLEENERKLTA